jgi:hypothetical protein
VIDPFRIPMGAQAPYELRYVLSSSKVDLTLITSARFSYRRNSGKGARESWTAATQNVTPRRVELVHVFALGDVPVVDEIVFEPAILCGVLGPGELIGPTRTLIVFDHPNAMLGL